MIGWLGWMMCAAWASPFTFEDVTLAGGLGETYHSATNHSPGVVWLDFDNDGLPDIFASNGFDDLQVPGGAQPSPPVPKPGRWNLRVGGPPWTNRECVGAGAADIDGDGDTDIYVYTAHEVFDVFGFANPADGPANILLRNTWMESAGASDAYTGFVVRRCPSVPPMTATWREPRCSSTTTATGAPTCT